MNYMIIITNGLKEMIKINKIIPPTYPLYDPDDNLLGDVNEFEFNDIRIQIVKAQIEGYYIKDDDEKLFIHKKGYLDKWPDGFQIFEIQLSKLFKAIRENGQK